MLRNVLILMLITVAGAVFLLAHKSKLPVVLIQQFATHDALDKVSEGIKTALSENKLPVQLKIDNANNNMDNANTIAHTQASSAPDVIVAIATGSLQAALKTPRSEKTLLTFAAVTDPRAAGVSHGEKLMGITDMPPLLDLVSVITHTMPDKKRVGILFNHKEINSVKSAEAFTIAAQNAGLKVISLPISSANDIEPGLLKLVGKADIIYVPQDNLLYTDIDTLSKSAFEKRLPVISNDVSQIDHGVLLALGYDYFEVGRKLGHMIAGVLTGQAIAEPRIRSAIVMEYRVNKEIAEAFGINAEALKNAKP
jgi:putative ABC transport system substrate-binding protein